MDGLKYYGARISNLGILRIEKTYVKLEREIRVTSILKLTKIEVNNLDIGCVPNRYRYIW